MKNIGGQGGVRMLSAEVEVVLAEATKVAEEAAAAFEEIEGIEAVAAAEIVVVARGAVAVAAAKLAAAELAAAELAEAEAAELAGGNTAIVIEADSSLAVGEFGGEVRFEELTVIGSQAALVDFLNGGE